MPGRIFAVVGPAGAGKETLIAAASRARPDLHIVRRVITRPPQPGGEPFESVTEQEFSRLLADGRLILDWEAYGFRYGIPDSIDRAMSEGRDVIFNASRSMLGHAWEVFSGLTVIHVTAALPVLAERLASRGRDSRTDIAQRLTRASYDIPYGIGVRVVENSGSLEQGVAAFLHALQPDSL